MTDGMGTTIYTYNPITGSVTTGGGRLASISTPIAGGTAVTAYSYDELGRVVNRSIGGTDNVVTTTFDALGRVTNVTNPLGSFGYGYVDTTSRLSSVTYPSSTGLSTSYSYFGNTSSDSNPADDDQRLADITNSKSGATMSKFDYTYNPVGTIATWTQQTGTNTPNQYALRYDNADQLTDAEQTNTSTGTLVTSNKYSYDPAGNRLAQITSTGTTTGRFNNLNQLTAYGSSSTIETVSGNVAVPASVTVNAVPATITQATNFNANVPLPSGTNVLSVVATDTAGNVTTKRFQAVISGTLPPSLSYDANGNVLTDENGNSYQWDALNRLVKITYPSGACSQFAYDGLSRRVQIEEKNSSSIVTSTKNYLWIGSEIAEERDASNNVTKRFFPQGEQQAGASYYYTRDQLGSVREMCDGSGAIVSRLSYDCMGRVTTVSGTNLPTKQYAGYYQHLTSGLSLTKYRAYSANTGRWMSRDPINETGGINLYGYCGNDPVDNMDSLGLAPAPQPPSKTDLPYWSDPSRINDNNCYNYALDRADGDWKQPGGGDGYGFFGYVDCASLKAKVKADGATEPDAKGCCPAGTHKIRLWAKEGRSFWGAGGDYHFYRQNGDGSWTSKPGVTPAVCITDPSKYDPGYKSCGDMCVKNQPPHTP